MKKTFIILGIGVCIIGFVWYITGFIKKHETEYGPEKLPNIVVESPKPDSRIMSPLMVRGKARGNWFFEASFPIMLQNEKGETIATTIGRAEGDWMTEQYVAFSSELLFPKQTADTRGLLIFKKDNPSGLPEYDASISIPITF